MSGSAQSSQSSGLSGEFAPYLQQYGSMIQGVAGLPYQQFKGPRVAELSGTQQSAIGNYGGLMDDPGWGMAANTLADLGSGSMNPFTEQVENRVTQGVTDRFNQATRGTTSAFNSAGGLGSARHQLAENHNQENLAQGLGDSLGALRSNEWNSMQGRRAQAVGLGGQLAGQYSGILGNAMQAGDVPRQFDQRVIDTNYGDWREANDYPYSQLQRVSGALGPLFGAAPRTTTMTGPGSDPIAQGLGTWQLANMLGGGGKSGAQDGGGGIDWGLESGL
jgi:hypothetical protein